MSANLDTMVKNISELTLLETAELVKKLEEVLGVSAAPQVVATAAAGGEAQAAAEEKTEFDVILASMGSKKLDVIKEVRAITGLPLGEAKALVEGAPRPVKEGIAKDEAEKIKEKLTAAGATVELK